MRNLNVVTPRTDFFGLIADLMRNASFSGSRPDPHLDSRRFYNVLVPIADALETYVDGPLTAMSFPCSELKSGDKVSDCTILANPAQRTT